MKSMKQMQDEMLSKCKLDGSFPRPVVMGFPPVIALARNQEELDKLLSENDRLIIFAAILLSAIGIAAIGFVAWAAWVS